MLNVLIIAGALASVGVASRESLVTSPEGMSPEGSFTIHHSPFNSSQSSVAGSQWSVGSGQSAVVSGQSSVGSSQGEISTLYSPISSLYSPISTLEKDSTLSEVTISAPKYPEKLARTGKVVSVISA